MAETILAYGPWHWHTDSDAEGGLWTNPPGSRGVVLDLRSRAERTSRGVDVGMGLFSWDDGALLPAGYTAIPDSLGPEHQALLGVTATRRDTALWERLTTRADPTGETGPPPLMPGRDGHTELWVAGRRVGRKVVTMADPEWPHQRERFRRTMPTRSSVRPKYLWTVLRKLGVRDRDPSRQDAIDLLGIDEAPSRPSTSDSDAFSGTNGDLLAAGGHTTDGVNAYAAVTGSLEIESNQLVGDDADTSITTRRARVEANLSSDDHDCEIVVVEAGGSTTGRHVAVCGRFDPDADNCYLVAQYNENASFAVRAGIVEASTHSDLGTGATQAGVGTIRFTIDGSTVTVYFNGGETESFSDTTLTGYTRYGVQIRDNHLRTCIGDNAAWADIAAAPGGAIEGSSDLAFMTTATLIGTGTLTGASSNVFTLSAILTGVGALTGSSAIAFTGTGSLAGQGTLAGVVELTCMYANLGSIVSINGSSDLFFFDDGFLTDRGPLFEAILDGDKVQAVGSSQDGVYTVESTLVNPFNSQVFTVENLDEDADGGGVLWHLHTSNLIGLGALAGQSDLIFALDANLTAIGILSGASSPVFTLVGDLQDTDEGAVEGITTMTFTLSATLEGAGALAGTSDVAFSLDSTALGAGALAGQSDAAFTGTGEADAIGFVQGAADIAFTNDGALAGSGTLSGQVILVFTDASTLAGSGALSGTTAAIFSVDGTLIGLGAGPMTGACAVAFSLSGTMYGFFGASGYEVEVTSVAPQKTVEATTLTGVITIQDIDVVKSYVRDVGLVELNEL